MKAIKVTTEGVVSVVDLAEPIWSSVNDEIGGFEIIRPKADEWLKGLVMVIDDDGLRKGLDFNCVGTFFYDRELKHSRGIVGDILIMSEGMTDDGPDFVDMTQDLIKDTVEIMTVIFISLRYRDKVKVERNFENTGWAFYIKDEETRDKVLPMIESLGGDGFTLDLRDSSITPINMTGPHTRSN